jgi:hypothetical protein
MRRSLLLLFLFACDDDVPASPPRVDPQVSQPAQEVEEPAERAVDEPVEEPQVDELVFGPSRAAYDLSGWSPRAIEPHRPEESFTASDYHFHYADVPGHPGVRAATNRVTLTLESGAGREIVLGIVEAERAEIAGQVPSAGFYQLRLPTTTFEEGMAATARIRATPGVRVAAYSPSSYFEAE